MNTTLRTPDDRREWVRQLYEMDLPLRVAVKSGEDRSAAQNRLSWEWCHEIAQQRGDMTAAEVHAFNKLHFGIPILREDEGFRETYDASLRPIRYEQKLKLMEGDFIGVTRLMTTKEMTRYLDAVYAHWTAEGVKLTIPEDR